MDVCLSWLANIRGFLVSIAIHAGMPAVAIRHGCAALENLNMTVSITATSLLVTAILSSLSFSVCLQEPRLLEDSCPGHSGNAAAQLMGSYTWDGGVA